MLHKAIENNINIGETVSAWATTDIYSDEDKTIKAWVGFEAAARSNRISGGIGPQGKWESQGRVWVNGQEIFPAKQWNEPGKYRYHYNTWHQAPNELPYTDEQLFWMREPAYICLKAGWNSVTLCAPRLFNINNWIAAFIPVSIDSEGRLHEAEGIKFR